MTFLLSSGIKFTVGKPSRPKRDWHETLWEIYHSTAYVDSRGRDWSEGSEYGLSHIGIRPWARPAATIAEDIKRRAVEPALRDHEANLQKIEQINEGIRRQVHTAKIVRQVLGNTTPSAMYFDNTT